MDKADDEQLGLGEGHRGQDGAQRRGHSEVPHESHNQEYSPDSCDATKVREDVCCPLELPHLIGGHHVRIRCERELAGPRLHTAQHGEAAVQQHDVAKRGYDRDVHEHDDEVDDIPPVVGEKVRDCEPPWPQQRLSDQGLSAKLPDKDDEHEHRCDDVEGEAEPSPDAQRGSVLHRARGEGVQREGDVPQRLLQLPGGLQAEGDRRVHEHVVDRVVGNDLEGRADGFSRQDAVLRNQLRHHVRLLLRASEAHRDASEVPVGPGLRELVANPGEPAGELVERLDLALRIEALQVCLLGDVHAIRVGAPFPESL
mmetsp:Transcript_109003/g.314845  ORF Transcript_109003/g.314845 Transcript_109003/m.314845 type:complete len:312 (+) Transcript_109003:1392-2327(+)